MTTLGKPEELSRSAAGVFERFVDLSGRDQLHLYQVVTEHLAARDISVTPDKALVAQAESVAAILRVAGHLGLEDPTELHNKAFNAAPTDIREGWTVARVIKAHGTWNAAKAVAAGEKAVPTARQRSVRRARARRLRTDDYIAVLKEWLASDPPKDGVQDYLDWAREKNATRSEGEIRRPGYSAIRRGLGVGWRLVLKVARGEMSLAEARKQGVTRRSGGAGLFVTTMDLVALSGKGGGAVLAMIAGDDFPISVLRYTGRRYWYRADVEAFLRGESFPKRKLDELNDRYIGGKEAAPILGVSVGSVDDLKSLPEPAYRGGRKIWLKTDIEAFRDQRARNARTRGR